MPVSKTKTYTFVYVFCFIFQKLILRPYKCPAKKILLIITLSISISKTLFGDYGKYASKKKETVVCKERENLQKGALDRK